MLATAAPELVTEARYLAVFGEVPTPQMLGKLAAVASAVRRRCGWHIGPVVDQTFTVDGRGAGWLVLPTLRMVDLLALTVDGAAQDVTGVEWSHRGMIRGIVSARRYRGVQVTIRHGFDDYDDLVQLVGNIAQRAQQLPDGNVAARTVGSVSYTYREPGLFAGELEQLEPYRLPRGVARG